MSRLRPDPGQRLRTTPMGAGAMVLVTLAGCWSGTWTQTRVAKRQRCERICDWQSPYAIKHLVALLGVLHESVRRRQADDGASHGRR